MDMETMKTDPDLRALDDAIRQLPAVMKDQLQIHDIFKSIHQKMIRGHDYQEILEFLFTSLSAVIPFDRIGIAILDDKFQKIKLSWVQSKMPIEYLRNDFTTVIKGSSLEHIFESGEPRIITDLEEYFKEHPDSSSAWLAIKDGIKSNLTYPLILKGKPIGVVFFSSATPFTYNESHIDIFEEIAEEISLIVDHELLMKKNAAAEEKEKLFRTTIHELNNPLGVIRGVLDVIKRKEWFNQLTDESKSIFQILKRKNEAMIGMVKDLSTVNQLKGAKLVNPSSVALEDFLQELLNNAQMLAKNKEMKIVMSKGPNLPETAIFDPVRIMQALENLIANAVNYSNPGTEITIQLNVDQTKGRLLFSVKDQGQGIPESEMNKLFREFGKTSVRPTKGEPSSGLGLSIVKSVVEAHNGEVSVLSQVGVGSTFSFWIPIIH